MLNPMQKTLAIKLKNLQKKGLVPGTPTEEEFARLVLALEEQYQGEIFLKWKKADFLARMSPEAFLADVKEIYCQNDIDGLDSLLDVFLYRRH